ncbi:MAG: hypothetical protein WAU70_13150 [Flavobacteriales bacterium]
MTSDSSIMVIGGPNSFFPGPILLRLDSNGDIIDSRENLFYWIQGRSGSLKSTPDGNWLTVGHYSADYDNAAIFKFSPMLDSLQLALVNSTILYYPASVDVAADSSVWVFGQSVQPEDYYAMHFNNQLQLLDSVRYVTAQEEKTANGVVTLDGGYVISGERVLSASDWNIQVIKVDAVGNVQWERSLGASWLDTGGFINQSSDSSYYVACGYRWPGIPHLRSTLIHLNSAGDTLWHCMIPINDSWLVTRPMITATGQIVAAGRVSVNNQFLAQLVCADTSGMFKWARSFATGTMIAQNFLDLLQHPDGGFVMVGNAFDSHGFVRPWVVKTDSMGCLVPGCDAVQGIMEQQTDLPGALSVSPNPSNGPLSVSIALPAGLITHGPWILTIVDALGHIVLIEDIPSATTHYDLSLDEMRTGVYHLHLTAGAQWLAGASFVSE